MTDRQQTIAGIHAWAGHAPGLYTTDLTGDPYHPARWELFMFALRKVLPDVTDHEIGYVLGLCAPKPVGSSA